MRKMICRFKSAFLKIPSKKDWLDAAKLLTLYALIYLPIGLNLGFLNLKIEAWQTIVGVTAKSFFMPAISEELIFRGLLIPHPTESCSKIIRQFWIVFSWFLFVVYHLHPFVPQFFRTPAFLIGAGLLGIVCTSSYLRSGSLWTAIAIHWLIVNVWLLGLGGISKFQN